MKKIWEYIDHKRPIFIKKHKWKQSYEGVCEALNVYNILMITSRDSFYSIKIPHTKNKSRYMRRKIQVLYPDGKICKSSTIVGLLNYSFKRNEKKNNMSVNNSDLSKIDNLFYEEDMKFLSELSGIR